MALKKIRNLIQQTGKWVDAQGNERFSELIVLDLFYDAEKDEFSAKFRCQPLPILNKKGEMWVSNKDLKEYQQQGQGQQQQGYSNQQQQQAPQQGRYNAEDNPPEQEKDGIPF